MMQIRKPKPLWGTNYGVRNPALEELREELGRIVDDMNAALREIDTELRERGNTNGTMEN